MKHHRLIVFVLIYPTIVIPTTITGVSSGDHSRSRTENSQGQDHFGRTVYSGSYVIKLTAGHTVDLKRVSLLK